MARPPITPASMPLSVLRINVYIFAYLAVIWLLFLMKRRVVITGMGAVSPNGIGTEAFWSATRNGISGVGPITRFDASEFAVRVAGEVKDFKEEDYVAPKDRP